MSQPDAPDILTPTEAAASWREFLAEMWPCVEVFKSLGLTTFQALLIMQIESVKNTLIELAPSDDDDPPKGILPGDEWKL